MKRRSLSKQTLLSAAWVYPVSQKPISNGALLIEKDKIVDIGLQKELEKRYPRSKKIKLKNSILLPGFVNTHCHLVHDYDEKASRDFSTWFKSMVSSVKKNKKTSKDLKQIVKKGLNELIHSGVTTVADSGPTDFPLKQLKKRGLRAIFYQEVFGFTEAQPDKFSKKIIETLKQNQESYPDRIRLGLAPHSPYTMPTKMFRDLSRLCLQEKIPLTTHVAESKEETLFFQKGKGALAELFPGRKKQIARAKSSVQYLSANRVLGSHLLSAHCVQVDSKDVSLLANKDVNVSFCPTSNQFLNVGTAPVHELLKRKVTVGLGTDGASTSGSLNFFQTLRDAALLGRLECDQVIRLATLGGATAMGMEKEIGSLKKGKKADCVAIKIPKKGLEAKELSSYLVWKGQSKDILFSMVNGKVLF